FGRDRIVGRLRFAKADLRNRPIPTSDWYRPVRNNHRNRRYILSIIVMKRRVPMDELEIFLAIVEEGSQTAAARRLGRSLQSVNRMLAKLERGVGVELVRRTTRRSIPSEAGLAFYDRVRPAISEIVEARFEASSRREEPSGLLRVSAPGAFSA